MDSHPRTSAPTPTPLLPSTPPSPDTWPTSARPHPGSFSSSTKSQFAKIRQRQAQAAETEAWNHALAAQDGCLAKAAKMMAESGEWARIMRYETRFNRQYYCALEQFLAARKLR